MKTCLVILVVSGSFLGCGSKDPTDRSAVLSKESTAVVEDPESNEYEWAVKTMVDGLIELVAPFAGLPDPDFEEAEPLAELRTDFERIRNSLDSRQTYLTSEFIEKLSSDAKEWKAGSAALDAELARPPPLGSFLMWYHRAKHVIKSFENRTQQIGSIWMSKLGHVVPLMSEFPERVTRLANHPLTYESLADFESTTVMSMKKAGFVVTHLFREEQLFQWAMRHIPGDDDLKEAANGRISATARCMAMAVVEVLEKCTSYGQLIDESTDVDATKADILREIAEPVEISHECHPDDVHHLFELRQKFQTETVEKYVAVKKVLGFVLDPSNRNEGVAPIHHE